MADELFSQRWVDAWKERINASSRYAKAARAFSGTLGMVVDSAPGDDGGAPAILLELDAGACHGARRLAPSGLAAADYVLSAPEATWTKLLDEGRDPVWALMSGKLALTRGSMTGLMSFAGGAKELLAAARGIDLAAAPRDRQGRVAATPSPAEDRPAPVAVPANGGRSAYKSTGPAGLDRDSPPMRLWEKAKVRGVWNPAELDFADDRADWSGLDADERDLLMRETSLFLAGEEAVTLDLLPLIQAVAAEGRLEEEIYLASFLWEEAKHVDAFSRFFEEIVAERRDLDRFHTPSYRTVFYDELPAALDRLRTDGSPTAQAEASVTYHMIVEGVLAETGYHGYSEVLDRHRILPGMRALIGHVQADEARHLAYGVFFLSRLVAEHGEGVWQAIESRMERLLPLALQVVDEAFSAYDPVPFGLDPGAFAEFAQDQFRRRFSRIEKARRQSLAEVYRTSAAGDSA